MVDALFPFALDRFGKTFFEAAWLDFWLGDPPSTKEFTDVPEFDAMFVPWFVTRFVPDRRDGRAEPHWPDVPVGLHWLASAASRIDPREREWLLAACASPMSVFTIEAVDSGRSVDIRDMLTGRRFHVLEQRGSQGLREGDLYFTRVVTMGDASLMFGAAPYAFPPRFQLQALDWRDGLFGRRAPRRSQLDEYEREIRRAYLVFTDQLLNPAPPRLQNTDGDDLALTTLEYEVRIPVAEVLERLRPLATLGADEHISDVVEDASGAVRRAVLQWVKRGNRKMKQWDNTILGTLTIDDGRLTAEVNSARRADRLVREIGKRLGSRASLKVRSLEDLSKRLGEATIGAARGADARVRAEEKRPRELVEYEDELYRQHLESWIDTRVPALGNRTPRELSRSPRGRERLSALLAGIEEGQDGERPARARARAALRRTLRLDR